MLVALLLLGLFLIVWLVGLQCVVVVFPDHTHSFYNSLVKVLKYADINRRESMNIAPVSIECSYESLSMRILA